MSSSIKNIMRSTWNQLFTETFIIHNGSEQAVKHCAINWFPFQPCMIRYRYLTRDLLFLRWIFCPLDITEHCWKKSKWWKRNTNKQTNKSKPYQIKQKVSRFYNWKWYLNPCQHKNVYRTLGGNVLGMFLWKVFLISSEHLCWSLSHNHQGIFVDHLTL